MRHQMDTSPRVSSASPQMGRALTPSRPFPRAPRHTIPAFPLPKLNGFAEESENGINQDKDGSQPSFEIRLRNLQSQTP
ncbi:hypothetical protein CGCF413_v005583 [Colletotrichum fructicola]|nr:hypothetical protein CGCF413_v005583 [Colletotrichum fructicola]